jgi:3-oxoadipate enol-lactonase
MRADLRPYCAAIAVPVLCVVGEDDGSTPPTLMRDFAGQIRRARFEIIPAAAHLSCVERPDVLRGLIEALTKGAAA